MTEELFKIRESNTQHLANLKNWASILDKAIPDNITIGIRHKVGKADIISAITNSINTINDNNWKLQKLIDPNYPI